MLWVPRGCLCLGERERKRRERSCPGSEITDLGDFRIFFVIVTIELKILPPQGGKESGSVGEIEVVTVKFSVLLPQPR